MSRQGVVIGCTLPVIWRTAVSRLELARILDAAIRGASPVATMTERKVATDLEVGESYAPYSFHVTPELNEQYCFAEEDYDARYRQGEDGNPPLVHPALILNMSNRTRSPSFYMPEGRSVLHAKDIIEFCAPAYVGKELNVTWTVCERYEKRGRDFMVIDCRVVDEDGREIFRRYSHNTHIKGEGA